MTSFFVDALETFSPSKSAYSKARKKLSSSCYDSLNQELLEGVAMEKTWKAHQVKAVDGSTLKLPFSSSCVEAYGAYDLGPKSHAKPTCMARVSIFYDVLNKLVLDNSIDHYTCSEKDQFAKFEHLIKADDILLMDNYYGKYAVLDATLNKKAHFVIPLTAKLHVVRRFLKFKRKKERVSQITFADTHTKQSITIEGRLMKKKINGEYKVLFTSLMDNSNYSCNSIFDLYTKRWEVEGCYGQLKNTLELADWSGTSPLAVSQDFKSKILLYNLTRALSIKIKPPRKKVDRRNKDTKRKRIINFSNALSRCKSLLRNLLKGKPIEKLIADFIANVGATVEYSRKGQSNPRKYWEGRKYHINQKHA